jgi:uncharacterized membrane protein
MSADLIVVKFTGTYTAQRAMAEVRALEDLRDAWIEDVAIVERHGSGRLSTHTTHGSVTGGALWGGLTGIIVGLLFPPAGLVGLWVLGAAAGAGVEALTKEHGLDESLLERVKASLSEKATSALVLIGAEGDVDEMTRAFEPYEPVEVIREALPRAAAEKLRDTVAEAQSEADDTRP